jgi:hypothetical protein
MESGSLRDRGTHTRVRRACLGRSTEDLPRGAFSAGGSIAPPLLLLPILFLGSHRPLPNATALPLGYFTTCAAMGIVGLTLFSGAESVTSTIGRVISAMVGGLLVVLGLRSLLNAPDPDAQPPRWMESISSISPPRAFGVGMALFPFRSRTSRSSTCDCHPTDTVVVT